MRAVDLIHKKKNNVALTKDEISFFINGYVNGDIPDYQASALTMAIYFNGMTDDEIAFLTEAMVASGDTIDLSFINGIKVDKHSTGGVGDKISLIVAPIVASLGIPVAKMSGRGLGHTGGTIDKLESIKGFSTELSIEQFKENVSKYGIAIVGQTGNLVPADKKLYALRDVVDTVDSLPLIASSIMSKKLASGADAIVLDVKVGNGAFMKDVQSAEKLARTMVDIGTKLNRKTTAIISNMNQPLGQMVGNLNEIQEVVACLTNKDISSDLQALVIEISAQMLVAGEKAANIDDAKEKVINSIANGKAYAKFVQFIEAQGGDIASIEGQSALYHTSVLAKDSGYIAAIHSEEVGIAAMKLGAGRETKEDTIDHKVGIKVNVKIGHNVTQGDVLFDIYSNKLETGEIQQSLLDAVTLSQNKVMEEKTIIKVITSSEHKA